MRFSIHIAKRGAWKNFRAFACACRLCVPVSSVIFEGKTTRQCASETSRGLLSLGDDATPLIKGRLNENVAPGRGLFDAHIRPPWAVIIVWQIDNPRPMPLGLVV